MEIIMLFVAASSLSASDIALLGNNIRPSRHKRRVTPDERENRRTLAAVNRSLALVRERVDRLSFVKTVRSTESAGRLAS
jgi:hypothetical protein